MELYEIAGARPSDCTRRFQRSWNDFTALGCPLLPLHGVTCIHVQNGMSLQTLTQGLETFAKAQAGP
uniref:Magnesium dependent phosphatase 1 n=1 Tax=Rousettus aegyptiacus TaxID=9407 RepID=A0A7J8IMJ0_ROUAE|nr:magnesium dependent phosphatase 1 [Rousettus aegyptiacus]